MLNRAWWDDVATAVELACLTEDRTNDEQKALLRVAAKVDRQRSLQITGNPRIVAPYLELMADSTRVLEVGQRRIKPPAEIKASKRKARRAG